MFLLLVFISGSQECHSGNLTCRIYTLGSRDAWTEAEFSQKETILLQIHNYQSPLKKTENRKENQNIKNC